MKNFKSLLIVSLLFVFCMIIGCEDDVDVLMNLKQEYQVYVGEEVVLDLDIIEGLQIENNSTIIEINEKNIKGLSTGEVGITVKYKENEKKVKVKVLANMIVTKKSYEVYTGETFTLEVESMKGTNVCTTDSTIIEINGLEVTAKQKGTASILITNGSETENITVNVLENITISKSEYTLFVGEECLLEVNCEKGTIEYSTASELIKITDNKVTCLESGEAIITVKCLNIEKEIKIIILKKPVLKFDEKDIIIDVNSTVKLNPYIENGEGLISFVAMNDYLSVDENGLVTGLKEGNGVVKIKFMDQEIDVEITIIPDAEFTVENIELFVGESVEPKIVITKGSKENLVFTPEDNLVTYENGKITGASVGETGVKVKLGSVEKTILVIVKKLAINVLNESFDVDVLTELPLQIDYPEFLGDKILYQVIKKSVLMVKDNTIIPLSVGKTQVKIYLENHEDIRKIININITVDPVVIINLIHQETVLMKKEITTFGSYQFKEKVMGSVSRYLFADLNLIENIVPITDNEYVGKTATPEIISLLDSKQKPRTGVLLEEIKYITYHDTGNNTQGANAEMHARYMVSTDNINNRARSWHYTVDSNCVYHHIPDNEVSWQGDTYDAYSKSIGIETCVNKGSNLHLVWQRMGKLCASLINKYGMTIESIKQHYDWNQKECPQTLRKSGLYPYAISLVEGELIVSRALSTYDLKFESLNPEYLDDRGVIIKAPEMPIQVGYKVTITNDSGYNETVTLYSTLNPLA